MTKHTPGPWTAVPYTHPRASIVTSYTIECEETDEYSDTTIGEIYGPGVECLDMEANARLIAAAPDLLNTLRELEEYFDQRADADQPSGSQPIPNEEMTLLIEVRAAIAKAEGREDG